MNEQNEIITQDGEIIPAGVNVDQSLAIGLTRAEIDQQIATAKRYPRSIQTVKNKLKGLVCLDEQSAEDCMYSVPRAGKTIEGPSARFAEALSASYGNCRVSGRVVHVDRAEKFVEAEGIFHDLESNQATLARVRRSIHDKRGRIYSDDMIVTTGNAAVAIAIRNAVLKGVPRPIWQSEYNAAREQIMGDIETLANNRAKALTSFQRFGVLPEQIFAALNVKGVEDIGLEQVASMRAMYATLLRGDETVESMFSPAAKPFAKVASPLSDEPSEKPPADKPPETPAADPVETAAAAVQAAVADPIAAARAKGAADKAAGMAKRAVPPEYRDKQTLAQAWIDGWMAAPEPAKAGGLV